MTAPAGLLDKIGSRLFAAPANSGLFSPEDIAAAQQQGMLSLGAGLLAASGPSTQRTSLGQAFGQALQGAQQAHGQALDGATQRRMQGAQLGQLEARTAAQQRAEQARAQILAQYPVPDPQDKEGLTKWIDQTLPLWVQADPDTARSLADLRKSMGGGAERNLQAVGAGDRTVLLKPGTAEVVGEIQHGAAPRDNAAGIEQRAEMSRQRTFTREQQLARQYEARTKDFAEIADKAMVVFASAEDPSAAGDLSLIFAYMKLLDPGSVVREGEFATAANAGSVPEAIWGRYNRILQGERLAASVRADFVDRAKRLVRGNQERLRHVMGQYERRARQNGVDPSMVVYDYFDGLVADEPPKPKTPLSQYNFGGATK